ncbi:hypothetical protein DPMN_158914 [Dreissena polymorpha]|uniref:Uncharacterized protein n=1 Tax=Dreissena polymorpha TaxID=45954 RepID=A0A9D4EI50_DREPO|nr:hypothetical protein DPMN_158914 [Dreissena polymorpha]
MGRPFPKRSLHVPNDAIEEQQKQDGTISRSLSRSPSASQVDLQASAPLTETNAQNNNKTSICYMANGFKENPILCTKSKKKYEKTVPDRHGSTRLF